MLSLLVVAVGAGVTTSAFARDPAEDLDDDDDEFEDGDGAVVPALPPLVLPVVHSPVATSLSVDAVHLAKLSSHSLEYVFPSEPHTGA